MRELAKLGVFAIDNAIAVQKFVGIGEIGRNSEVGEAKTSRLVGQGDRAQRCQQRYGEQTHCGTVTGTAQAILRYLLCTCALHESNKVHLIGNLLIYERIPLAGI